MMRRCSGSLYQVLGVPPTADDAEIKKAYHKKALQYHPDKAGQEGLDMFKKVQEAHSILMNTEERKMYDTFGRSGLKMMNNDVGAAFSPMIMYPGLMKFFGIIVFLIAALLVTFLALLAVKVDKHPDWSWTVTFVPMWIFDGFVGLLAILALAANATSESTEHTAVRVARLARLAVNAASFIAATVLIVFALDGKTSWNDAFIPILIFVSMSCLSLVSGLSIHSYRELERAAGNVYADDIMPCSFSYIAYLLITSSHAVCMLSFIVLLMLKSDGSLDSSYWVVFSPAIFQFAFLPFVTLLCQLHRMPQEFKCRDKVCHVFLGMFSLSPTIVQVCLLAAKCSDPSSMKLSVALIPAYILSSIILLVAMSFCFMTFRGPPPDENEYQRYEDDAENPAASQM